MRLSFHSIDYAVLLSHISAVCAFRLYLGGEKVGNWQHMCKSYEGLLCSYKHVSVASVRAKDI
jgi:hypothetical protein